VNILANVFGVKGTKWEYNGKITFFKKGKMEGGKTL
jgi:hypothetical protein